MRCILALLAIVFAGSASAEDGSARLFGSWRLVSFQLEVVGEQGAPKDVFWPPSDRPDHLFSRASCRCFHFKGRQAAADQRIRSCGSPVLNDRLYRQVQAGRRQIPSEVDGAWNEVYKGSEQVRYFELTGDKLSIRTPEQQSGILIGKRTVATLVWERETP